MSNLTIKKALLLSYVGLLAERHAYRPDEGFEYQLWDDLRHYPGPMTFVSRAEAKELIYLSVTTDSWVTCNLEIGMLQVIEMDAWMLLLEKRGH